MSASWRWAASTCNATSHLRRQLQTLYVRSHLVSPRRAAGIEPPIDSVYPHLDDHAGLRDQAEFAATLGFFGKSAIHPTQLATIHAAFAPDHTQLQWAHDVIHAFEAADGNAVRLPTGEFIDLPVAQRARNILRAAVTIG